MGLVSATFSANPQSLPANLADANAALAGCTAEAIIDWALARAARPVVTTNFRPGAAALLHLVTRALPTIPVVWVDTGYNTPATYRHVERLAAELNLNLKVYTPRVSVARRAALGGVPAAEASDFARFAREMKTEPFERAFNELAPDVWFTGIRADQSAFRASLDVASRGAGNTLRVAPLFHWDEASVKRYLALHGIADNADYVDPTKPGAHLECGVQLLA